MGQEEEGQGGEEAGVPALQGGAQTAAKGEGRQIVKK